MATVYFRHFSFLFGLCKVQISEIHITEDVPYKQLNLVIGT